MLMFSVVLGVCPMFFIRFKCHFSKSTYTCIFHFMHSVSFVNLHLVYNYQLISHLHHLHTHGFNFKQLTIGTQHIIRYSSFKRKIYKNYEY